MATNHNIPPHIIERLLEFAEVDNEEEAFDLAANHCDIYEFGSEKEAEGMRVEFERDLFPDTAAKPNRMQMAKLWRRILEKRKSFLTSQEQQTTSSTQPTQQTQAAPPQPPTHQMQPPPMQQPPQPTAQPTEAPPTQPPPQQPTAQQTQPSPTHQPLQTTVFRDEDDEDKIRAVLSSKGIGEHQLCKVVLLGSPGAGKSFLANVLSKDMSLFESAEAVRSVTHGIERVLIDAPVYGKPVLIYNIPGVCDADSTKDEAHKKRILRAFRELPKALCAPVLIFQPVGGRFTAFDVHVTKSIVEFISAHRRENVKYLTFIGNGVEKDRRDWELEVMQVLRINVGVGDPHVDALPRVTTCPLKDQEFLEALFKSVKGAVLRVEATLDIPQTADLNVTAVPQEKINELEEKLKKQHEAFTRRERELEKQNKQLQQQDQQARAAEAGWSWNDFFTATNTAIQGVVQIASVFNGSDQPNGGGNAQQQQSSSFGQAFAAARKAQGRNGVFTFNGKQFTTNYAGEH